ncbi:HNH endonuclease family protein [Corynebacterium sp. 35RC1]|nr:HNH endonuclease family protein [Corynebacterium sp. 35RC1]
MQMVRNAVISSRRRKGTRHAARRSKRWTVVGILGLLVAIFAGVANLPGKPQIGSGGVFDRGLLPAQDVPVSTTGAAADAFALLSELGVQDELPLGLAEYQRSAFGQRWSDDVEVEFGHNGCDTRNDILKRDLLNPKFRPGTRDCVVVSGTLQDPYSGTTHEFLRGEGTSDLVQIDHVVALANAWRSGAASWDPATRQAFANDPKNLQATLKQENQRKGAQAADGWLPSNPAFACGYATAQIEVKHAYALSVTTAERQALVQALQTCT